MAPAEAAAGPREMKFSLCIRSENFIWRGPIERRSLAQRLRTIVQDRSQWPCVVATLAGLSVLASACSRTQPSALDSARVAASSNAAALVSATPTSDLLVIASVEGGSPPSTTDSFRHPRAARAREASALADCLRTAETFPPVPSGAVFLGVFVVRAATLSQPKRAAICTEASG